MDGDLATKFWNKVEGIGNVFVFVRSEHGKTFGGYRSVPYKRPIKEDDEDSDEDFSDSEDDDEEIR